MSELQYQTTKQPKINFPNFFSWFLGTTFVLTGLTRFAAGDIISALMIFLIGATLLPPVGRRINSFLQNKFNFSLFASRITKVIAIIICFFVLGVTANNLPDTITQNQLLDKTVKQSETTAPKAKPNTGFNTTNITKTYDNAKTNNQSPVKLDKVTVSRHIDGDTIYVKFDNGTEEKVRFIGVNTPESTIRHEPYGQEASNFTKERLAGKTIYLEKDVSDRDKYGRLLRYIWLDMPQEINEQEIREKMFNAVLLLEGYAQLATYPPDVKYVDYFTKFQKEAREQNKGLWSLSMGNINSTNASLSSSDVYVDSNGRGLIKGNINSKGEKIYHMPGGVYYDKTIPEYWFKTEEEAQAAGFRRSKR